MNQKIKKLESMIESYEKSAVMQESYDKRLNILIHGIKEDNDSSWEKHDTTVTKFQEFLKKGLKIDDPEDIEFVDIHRLPQYLVKKNDWPFSRPIIVKLLTMHDKHLIFKSVKHLQSFNNVQKNEDQSVPYVYVTEHLPKKFQDQRKQLLPIFNDVRKNKKKSLLEGHRR